MGGPISSRTLVEIVGIGELAQQMRHVTGHVRIVQSQLALVTVANSLLKEWFERMSLRCIHTSRGLEMRAQPVCCEAGRLAHPCSRGMPATA